MVLAHHPLDRALFAFGRVGTWLVPRPLRLVGGRLRFGHQVLFQNLVDHLGHLFLLALGEKIELADQFILNLGLVHRSS